MDGIRPSVYEVLFGQAPYTVIYVVAADMPAATRAAHEVVARYPWEDTAPEMAAVREVCTPDFIAIDKKYLPHDVTVSDSGDRTNDHNFDK